MQIIRNLALTTATVAVFATPVFAQQIASPSLKILTPGPAQTIYGNTVPVLLSVENFKLVDYQSNTVPQVGQGHIHLWLDDDKLAKESAVKISTDNYAFTGVAPGDHTLVAELVNNNHTSLTQPVTTTVKFKTAAPATPSPAATSGFDRNTALVILVVVALVILAAWWYTKEEDEETVNTKQETGNTRNKATKRSRRK